MQNVRKLKVEKVIKILFLILIGISILVLISRLNVHAQTLVGDLVDSENEYSKYPLANYQLDFYVDDSWNWLPWNWGTAIGKSVMYGVYMFSNVFWMLSVMLSRATGHMIQEAFQLDFISSMSDLIGKNMQTLTGVSLNGLNRDGFYPKLLGLFIFILGVYIAYVGGIKRETTKAINALIYFLVVFVASTIFIAFSPEYISKLNEFSKDVSTGILSVGTNILDSNTNSSTMADRKSTDLIRDSLFLIQVKKPWLLLQFGETGVDESRVESILEIGVNEITNELVLEVDPSSTHPEGLQTNARELAVKADIEDNDNFYLSVSKVGDRLAMVLFIVFFNVLISLFIFMLTGMMILSQILFIVFAMLLPIGLLISLIPTYNGISKRAVEAFLNTIVQRMVLTVVMVFAFSISSMVYSATKRSPFFLVAVLQVLIFAGIYFSLPQIFGILSLQGDNARMLGSRIVRPVNQRMRRSMNHTRSTLNRNAKSSFAGGALGGAVGSRALNGRRAFISSNSSRYDSINGPSDGSFQTTGGRAGKPDRLSFGDRAGRKIGSVIDTPSRIKDGAKKTAQNIKDMPTNARYKADEKVESAAKNMDDFKSTVRKTPLRNREQRADDFARQKKQGTERRASFNRRKTDHSAEDRNSNTDRPVNGKNNHNESNNDRTNRKTTNSAEDRYSGTGNEGSRNEYADGRFSADWTTWIPNNPTESKSQTTKRSPKDKAQRREERHKAKRDVEEKENENDYER